MGAVIGYFQALHTSISVCIKIKRADRARFQPLLFSVLPLCVIILTLVVTPKRPKGRLIAIFIIAGGTFLSESIGCVKTLQTSTIGCLKRVRADRARFQPRLSPLMSCSSEAQYFVQFKLPPDVLDHQIHQILHFDSPPLKRVISRVSKLFIAVALTNWQHHRSPRWPGGLQISGRI